MPILKIKCLKKLYKAQCQSVFFQSHDDCTLTVSSSFQLSEKQWQASSITKAISKAKMLTFKLTYLTELNIF